MNFWHTIDKPIIGLSPMDGITDAPFRRITAKHGRPDLIVTEFVNVEAAFHAPHTLLRDLAYSEIERPVVAQIYGHTPEKFYQVAHIVCELGFDGLDINMGCPAKKVAATGSGAALIRTPELARSIIRAAKAGVRDWSAGQSLENLDLHPELVRQVTLLKRPRKEVEPPSMRNVIPVSVKSRIGYDRVVVEDWMGTLLEENPAAISLHGRTLKQMYAGSADWAAIGRAAGMAKNSGTLVLGNGDLRSMGDACVRIRETGVDGVLVGRAAQGNPWIFRAKGEAKGFARAKTPAAVACPEVGLMERFRVLVDHSLLFESRWENAPFAGMRKHLAWYCKGFRGAAELRARLVRVSSAREVIECLEDFSAAPFAPPAQNRALELGDLPVAERC